MTRWLQQQIRPLHHPFRIPGPVAVEGMLHPFAIGGPITSFHNTLQVNVSTASRVVRSLAGERIVEHDGIGHPENFATRGENPYRLANSRGETSRQDAFVVGEFNITAPLRLPREKSLEDMLAAGKMLSGSLDVGPAIHRPARNSHEHHDLA